MITVDFENSNKTLTESLYDSIKNQIMNKTLKKNEKLPSKRVLASHLGISVITVQNAYNQLIDEGYIYSFEKKGFFVQDIGNVVVQNQNQILSDKIFEKKKPDYFADFTSNSINNEKFPFTLWSQTMRQVLASQNENLLKQTDVFGSVELRTAIAEYLNEFRNMKVSPAQIVIGAGTEALYGMIVQFFGRTKIYAVENPGYYKTYEIITLNGGKCVPCSLDEQGIMVSSLERIKANLVHVSPSHHFPSGIITTVGRRHELLNWANSDSTRFIIEDDYDSEFRFNGKPLPTLQSIDTQNKVIYMNTFTKTLSPSFRISYMILPFSLVSTFSEKMGFCSCQVSSFEQLALARFINEKNYEKHINKMKNYYRSLRNTLISSLEKSSFSSYSRITEENSGLHFLLTFDMNIPGKELQQKFRENGINISLLDEYFYVGNKNRPVFVVNYSGIKKEQIGEIVRRMEISCQS